MKKYKTLSRIFILFIILFTVLSLAKFNTAYAIDSNNVVLEYCTGTWCGFCPCGHQIINSSIMPAYPNTVVIAYHGTSSDPWYAYSQTMLSAFGFSSYPTGVIGRTSGIQSRSVWPGYVGQQSALPPGIRIQVSNKTFNAGTRNLNATITMTALQDLPAGQYYIYFVITEDHLVYQQNHYASCGYTGYITDYVHNHVCKLAVNAPYGELITTEAWNNGVIKTKDVTINLPTHINFTNAHFNTIVYNKGAALASGSAIQNASTIPSVDFTITGINPNEQLTANKYELGQNYPNPFNPSTKINFSIPKADYVSLKFYDMSGKEVSTYLDHYYMTPGVYSAEFNGANLSSGIYFYTLKTNNFTQTKKMMLIK